MTTPSRRTFLAAAAAAVGGAGAAQAQASGSGGVKSDLVKAAEEVLGVAYTDEERAQLLTGLDEQMEAIAALRAMDKPNALAPAMTFDPRLPGAPYPPQPGPVTLGALEPGPLPTDPADIAFAPVWRQSAWMRLGALTSRELVEIYLDRIDAHAATLECFITVTADAARTQADAADTERAAGRVRGPLHGVPYGLKDLFDAAGAPTTWGATPYKDAPPAAADSAVAARLKRAGAVLLGKTTTGAIAYGDIWFGGVTRNPFNPEEGSSGSSAGSASATAAGLVSFAIGTETLGSIVSPSHRCGTTGLRPTFGRVSRAGGMALCWSLDKVGPITRSVADTALVLDALNGADPADPSSLEHDFAYDGAQDARGLVIGFDPSLFEQADPLDVVARDALADAGATLKEVTLPEVPAAQLVTALLVEAAAAFEDLTVSNRDDELRWQDDAAWPNGWRRARFVSAIDYIQIDRIRRRLMAQMHDAFRGIDALVGPNFAGGVMTATNFTGQPQLALRAGFKDTPTRTIFGQPASDEPGPAARTPYATSLWAPLFEERTLIRAGRALEAALGVADERPNLTKE